MLLRYTSSRRSVFGRILVEYQNILHFIQRDGRGGGGGGGGGVW